MKKVSHGQVNIKIYKFSRRDIHNIKKNIEMKSE